MPGETARITDTNMASRYQKTMEFFQESPVYKNELFFICDILPLLRVRATVYIRAVS